jgi:photosystem II stability/assembly factor-like uncharacterized protein
MKIFRLLAPFTGVLLLASTSLLHAGVNQWTLTGPAGGLISGVAVHPGDRSVLLASAGNGLYRSTNDGQTWTHTGDAYEASVVLFDPSSVDRVFAIRTDGRLFRSTDAGVSFSMLAGPENASPIYLTAANDGTLYLIDRRGAVFKCANGGDTWTPLAQPWALADDIAGAISVDPADKNVVLVGLSGIGTYRSVNGGTTWTASPVTGSPGTHTAQSRVFAMVFKPGATGHVVAASDAGTQVSVDGGVTWSTPDGIAVRALAFDPDQPNVAVAIMGGGQVWRSGDSGAHWTPGPALNFLQGEHLAFGHGHRLLLAGSDGPMVSDDAGVAFALRTTGIRAASIRTMSRTPYGHAYVSFLPGPFGIYVLDGFTWNPVDNDELRTRLAGFPMVFNFTVAPSNASRLYAVGTSQSVMTSFDAGQSWTQPLLQFLSTQVDIQRVTADPTDEKIVYLSTRAEGVWRSQDSGLSYVKRSTGLPNAINALAIDPVNPAVIYAGAWFTGSNGVFKSTDSGVSWTQVGAGSLGTQAVLDIAIDPANSQKVWAALQGGLYRSTDGGATWTQAGPAGFIALATQFDFELPGAVFLSGPTGSPGVPVFARSVDDGAHWQTVPSALVYPATGGLETSMIQRGFNRVYAGGIGTGLHEYQVSTDLAIEFGTIPAAIALNSTGTLQVTVRNLGPFDAIAPWVDIRAPANTTVPAPPAGCQPFQDVFRCVLPNLRNGQSQTFTLAYTAAATETSGTLQANVSAHEYDAVDPNNVAVASIVARALTDLAVTSTATAAAQTNAAVSFSATVSNGGPNDSETTTFSLTAPASITLQVPTTTAGSCATVANIITCNLGKLTNGSSATIAVSGTATIAGTFDWSSTVTGSGQDSASTNNASTKSSVISAPPPPPPPPGSGSSSGGKGGGGRLDWLVLLVLGGAWIARQAALRRRRPS